MKKYSLHVPADLSISSSVRTIAVRIFKEVGFEGVYISRLKLVFDELYMNAVRYGSFEGSTIFITFEFEEKTLRVCFEDEGGESKLSAEELQEIISFQKENKNPEKTSGRGLAQITHEWADDLQVWNGRRGGLCIAFSKSLPSAEDDGEGTPLKETPPEEMHPLQVAPGAKEKRFELSGEIDNSNLHEKVKIVESFVLDNVTPCLLILNLKKLHFCNSTFIAKLAMWKQALTSYGGDLVIENVQHDIYEILQLVGMYKIIHITKEEFVKEETVAA